MFKHYNDAYNQKKKCERKNRKYILAPNIDAALAFLKITLRKRRKTQQKYWNYLAKQKKNTS